MPRTFATTRFVTVARLRLRCRCVCTYIATPTFYTVTFLDYLHLHLYCWVGFAATICLFHGCRSYTAVAGYTFYTLPVDSRLRTFYWFPRSRLCRFAHARHTLRLHLPLTVTRLRFGLLQHHTPGLPTLRLRGCCPSSPHRSTVTVAFYTGSARIYAGCSTAHAPVAFPYLPVTYLHTLHFTVTLPRYLRLPTHVTGPGSHLPTLPATPSPYYDHGSTHSVLRGLPTVYGLHTHRLPLHAVRLPYGCCGCYYTFAVYYAHTRTPLYVTFPRLDVYYGYVTVWLPALRYGLPYRCRVATRFTVGPRRALRCGYTATRSRLGSLLRTLRLRFTTVYGYGYGCLPVAVHTTRTRLRYCGWIAPVVPLLHFTPHLFYHLRLLYTTDFHVYHCPFCTFCLVGCWLVTTRYGLPLVLPPHLRGSPVTRLRLRVTVVYPVYLFYVTHVRAARFAVRCRATAYTFLPHCRLFTRWLRYVTRLHGMPRCVVAAFTLPFTGCYGSVTFRLRTLRTFTLRLRRLFCRSVTVTVTVRLGCTFTTVVRLVVYRFTHVYVAVRCLHTVYRCGWLRLGPFYLFRTVVTFVIYSYITVTLHLRYAYAHVYRSAFYTVDFYPRCPGCRLFTPVHGYVDLPVVGCCRLRWFVAVVTIHICVWLHTHTFVTRCPLLHFGYVTLLLTVPTVPVTLLYRHTTFLDSFDFTLRSLPLWTLVRCRFVVTFRFVGWLLPGYPSCCHTHCWIRHTHLRYVVTLLTFTGYIVTLR